ncbi:MAG TPA: hypothetical protein VFW40_13810 [Capsulimonadaceae bacterium]|nr:hypothetical protein [Capsulimonadaceae bacterium]
MKHSESMNVIRRFTPLAFWLVLLCGVGWFLGGTVGAFLGFLAGAIWGVCALAGADRYAIYIHGGRPLNRIEAPNLHDLVDELAGKAGIDVPVLYALPFNEPNIVVCAGGMQSDLRGRIGVTNGLTAVLEREEVQALLGLAVARIRIGEAAAISTSSAAAGFLIQLATSSVVNFTIGNWLVIDPESGLTPIGKAVLLILAPVAWTTSRLSGSWRGCLEADTVATQLLDESVILARALEKVADAIPIPEYGSTAGFNPGTAPAFLVSPFEGQRGTAADVAERPFWQKARVWIARQTPSAANRASVLLGGTMPAYEEVADRSTITPRPTSEHVTWPP